MQQSCPRVLFTFARDTCVIETSAECSQVPDEINAILNIIARQQ